MSVIIIKASCCMAGFRKAKEIAGVRRGLGDMVIRMSVSEDLEKDEISFETRMVAVIFPGSESFDVRLLTFGVGASHD